jgi:hypothetical protein
MERTAASAPVPARPFQFTIRSLLWLMVTLAMVLAFVRPANPQLLPIALAAAVSGTVMGTLIGWQFSRVFDAIFWSLLAVSLATICIAGQPSLSTISWAQVVGWPHSGALAGAIAGAMPTTWLRMKLVACMVVAALPLAVLASFQPQWEMWGDVALAAVVGVLLVLLSELFTWARARYHTSYGGWAAALVLAVILGNWGAAWFTPILTNWLAAIS